MKRSTQRMLAERHAAAVAAYRGTVTGDLSQELSTTRHDTYVVTTLTSNTPESQRLRTRQLKSGRTVIIRASVTPAGLACGSDSLGTELRRIGGTVRDDRAMRAENRPVRDTNSNRRNGGGALYWYEGASRTYAKLGHSGR